MRRHIALQFPLLLQTSVHSKSCHIRPIRQTLRLRLLPFPCPEKKDLKDFQSAVALSLLKYTADLEDVYVERRLASALLFLTHLSSEITKGFANGDEKIASNLLADAIIECRRAYPDGKTKVSMKFH